MKHMKNKHAEFQYLDLAREILDQGMWNVDRGTGVRSLSLFGRQCRYDLSHDFPLLTTKRVYWKGVLHELYWFMAGMTNIKYLVDNEVHIWDDYPYKIYSQKFGHTDLTKDEFIEKIRNDVVFAKKWGELPKIYGEMWRRWPTRKPGKTVDQLQWVINELSEDPMARNAIVTSWNPEYLYTMADRDDASYFPICHNMYQVSIKDGRLYLQLYQRSADLFLGVPFNIASYALLNVVLARILGVKPGEFVHTFGDVHIYENHIEQMKEQLSREPKPFPKVKLDPSVTSLDTFLPDKVELIGYEPHKTIKGELTVAGGFYEKKKG
jgi:thymidylate synthase